MSVSRKSRMGSDSLTSASNLQNVTTGLEFDVIKPNTATQNGRAIKTGLVYMQVQKNSHQRTLVTCSPASTCFQLYNTKS